MLANPAAFVGLYIVFMIPTYLLPYLGSNSMAARAASALAGLSFLNIPFLLHLIAMLLLCLFCWIRGSHAGNAPPVPAALPVPDTCADSLGTGCALSALTRVAPRLDPAGAEARTACLDPCSKLYRHA
jgi:hypothetical protein